MSDDIKNFRQAVEKLDEMLIEVSRLDEKVKSNLDTQDNQKEVLQTINTLQMKSNDILNSFNNLSDNIKINNIKTINTLKSDLDNVTKKFNENINEAINNIDINIDVESIKKQIETSLKSSIEKISFSELHSAMKTLNKETENFNHNNNRLKDINDVYSKSLKEIAKDVKEDINNNINTFNKMRSIVNFNILALTFLVGAGAGIFIYKFWLGV